MDLPAADEPSFNFGFIMAYILFSFNNKENGMGKRLKKIEITFFFFTIILFFTLLISYYLKHRELEGEEIEDLKEDNIKEFTELEYSRNDSSSNFFINYSQNEKIGSSTLSYIYKSYPKSIGGREVIYEFFDKGDIKIADQCFNDLYEIERFSPVKINPPIKWDEDPYNERYWRFLFYSLRPTRHLLYAWGETGNDKYKDKLLEIIGGFIDNGMNKIYSWDDAQGVAFRTMTLINVWWKLREKNALSEEMSGEILEALKIHGEFLSERKHYDSMNNHGITQSAALLLLANNFPDMPGAKESERLSRDRLVKGIYNLIDKDGVLIENSPYYHFYIIQKYWQIYKYLDKYNVNFESGFKERMEKMISYGTFILQAGIRTDFMDIEFDEYIIKKLNK